MEADCSVYAEQSYAEQSYAEQFTPNRLGVYA